MKKEGFTLIELLAVIVIVGILLALLLPILIRVQENASNSQCINNLRQIGIALHMYVDDHQSFPARPSPWPSQSLQYWDMALCPQYLDDYGVFRCPSHTYDPSHTPYGVPNQRDYVLREDIVGQFPGNLPSTYGLMTDRPENTWLYYFSDSHLISSVHSGGSNMVCWGGNVTWVGWQSGYGSGVW